MLQLVSDVHLDVRRAPIEIRATAPTLVVAGDVMSFTDPNYRDYMQRLFANHRYGVYVPGNHDVWGADGPMSEVLDSMERVCASLAPRVAIMRSGDWGFDVPGTDTRVVGATLWTHVPVEMSIVAPQLLNDFRFIHRGGRDLTVEDVNAMHDVDRDWISRAISRASLDGKSVAVVTHHAPDMALAAYNASHSTDGMGVFYYCNDMSDVMRQDGIVAWMYGHCHESRVTRLRGLRYPFVTNAMGSPNEDTGYARGMRIEIP